MILVRFKKFSEEIDAFICKNNKTINGIVENGRLKIGILHDAKICTNDILKSIKEHPNKRNNCKKRNNISVNDLRGGMGDLFVKLTIN